MAQQNDATNAPEAKNVIEALAGEGRVEVEKTNPPEDTAKIALDTPEGSLSLYLPAHGRGEEGRDSSYYWHYWGYEIEVSLDGTPGNASQTVRVTEES